MSIRYRYFAANLALLWFLIFFYRTNPYYVKFLSSQAQSILLIVSLLYTCGGLIYYRFNKRIEPSHAYIALTMLSDWCTQMQIYLAQFPYDKNIHVPIVSAKAKNSLLVLLVKIFYLPLMINFLIGNFFTVYSLLLRCHSTQSIISPEILYTSICPLLINTMFVLDTALFTIGYSFESTRCNNIIKSVEPTVLGWSVALICYPPFSSIFSGYVPWYSSEIPVFSNVWFSVAAGIAMVICYAIYVWGSISLGWKCSNLTNRGIVTNGVYAYVRHPAYVAKNLAWWIGVLPVLSVPAILSTAAWTFIYFLRAITEERHLLRDPDYQEYCKKVRYRFIPYIY